MTIPIKNEKIAALMERWNHCLSDTDLGFLQEDIEKTLMEIISECLPPERNENGHALTSEDEAFNGCRTSFLQALKEKLDV